MAQPAAPEGTSYKPGQHIQGIHSAGMQNLRAGGRGFFHLDLKQYCEQPGAQAETCCCLGEDTTESPTRRTGEGSHSQDPRTAELPMCYASLGGMRVQPGKAEAWAEPRKATGVSCPRP